MPGSEPRMHEFSIMSQMVDVLKHEIEQRDLKQVREVVLTVGELSFLGEEQMRFCYNVLIEEYEPLKGSVLKYEPVPAVVGCSDCGYEGKINYLGNEEDHYKVPMIACPECNGPVKVISGRECIIKNIVAEVEE